MRKTIKLTERSVPALNAGFKSSSVMQPAENKPSQQNLATPQVDRKNQICIYVHIYICIYVHVYVYVYITHIYFGLSIFPHISLSLSLSLRLWAVRPKCARAEWDSMPTLTMDVSSLYDQMTLNHMSVLNTAARLSALPSTHHD